MRVEVTPADHARQNEIPGQDEHFRLPEDACWFWLQTPNGTIWAPGDSRLIPVDPGASPDDAGAGSVLFDFSDSDWHFGLAGAVRMANAYPNTPLLLQHWGSVAAPDFSPFKGT